MIPAAIRTTDKVSRLVSVSPIKSADAAITIGVVVWSVWPRRAEFPDPGVPLTKEDQPEL